VAEVDIVGNRKLGSQRKPARGQACNPIDKEQVTVDVLPVVGHRWGKSGQPDLRKDRLVRLQAHAVMFDSANFHATETLRDGRMVEIRALHPQDREALHTAVMRCSTETLYHRFFAVKREFSEKEIHFFLDIDFVTHVALAAVANEDGRETIVGSCRYVVVAPERAEVAFLVIDDYQRKGLGTVLMRRLAAIAREAGLKELVAEVLADNAPMLKVFEHSGLATAEKHEGPVVHVTLRCG